MPSFKGSLWNDSDPTYAPCLVWTARGRAEWRAQPRYVKAGYLPARITLTPGSKDDAHQIERAQMCREYTREMLRWWEDRGAAPVETVGWLIGRYKADEASEFQAVKANTREGYRYCLSYWEQAIGHLSIGDLTFERIKSIQAGMKANGRSDSFIHRMFTMLRSVFKHGKLIRAAGAKEVRETLGEIRFKMPPRRTVKPTRMQVYRIAAKAWAGGQKAFAVGVLLQFELTLRAVDVRGHWLDQDGEGGIRRPGKVWVDGLTWDMFAPDLWSFRKVISKTRDSLPDPITFDLRGLPSLRKRLLSLTPPDKRIGPVLLTTRDGLPFRLHYWSKLWNEYRAQARVPSDIWLMDTRAGAISEADEMGASREILSSAAQHQDMQTTARYVRTRDKNVATVIELRAGRKKG